MEKFNRTLRGYDPDEVNSFLDKIITKFELMVTELKEKDAEIEKLKYEISNSTQQNYSQEMEESIKKTLIFAEKSSEEIKLAAHQERELIINDAKKNANRIVNEALLRSENVDREYESIKRNINIFKNRLKDILETQLELVDDIEKIEI